jgi:Lrp/AsnC family transcriptional regulator
MDQKDREILRILQNDASLSMNELAERCALSKTAVWRRVRELQKTRVIRKQVTLLDAESLGFGLTIFAFVRTNQHSDAWFSKFKAAIAAIPEIQEFHRTSGDIDYVLRVVARDMRHYDEIYQQLIRDVDFADISSTFVMESFKTETGLPI